MFFLDMKWTALVIPLALIVAEANATPFLGSLFGGKKGGNGGGSGGGYGAPPPPADDGYGAPPPADDGYGAPAPANDGYGAPAPQNPSSGYGAPQSPPSYGAQDSGKGGFQLPDFGALIQKKFAIKKMIFGPIIDFKKGLIDMKKELINKKFKFINGIGKGMKNMVNKVKDSFGGGKQNQNGGYGAPQSARAPAANVDEALCRDFQYGCEDGIGDFLVFQC